MRQPKPFFRKQTKKWYVQIGKKQIDLGADKAEAKAAYHRLMAGTQDVGPDTTVVEILLQYLQWKKANHAASSFAACKRDLAAFGEHVCDRLTVAKLRNQHVTDWLAQDYPEAGNNYLAGIISRVKAAFNWAVRQGRLDRSPIASYPKPRRTPRERIIEADEWQAIEARVAERPELADIVAFLRQTGCRPQEARTLEARQLDREARCFVIEQELAKGGLDPRVIVLSDEALAIAVRLAANNPDGPIFRNSNGKPWTRRALGARFEAIGLDGVSAYTLRHTFATEALENGVDCITVATIMGHRNIKQLFATYQHLDKKSPALRAGLNKALGISEEVQRS